jgi:hypothetical protein
MSMSAPRLQYMGLHEHKLGGEAHIIRPLPLCEHLLRKCSSHNALPDRPPDYMSIYVLLPTGQFYGLSAVLLYCIVFQTAAAMLSYMAAANTCCMQCVKSVCNQPCIAIYHYIARVLSYCKILEILFC